MATFADEVKATQRTKSTAPAKPAEPAKVEATPANAVPAPAAEVKPATPLAVADQFALPVGQNPVVPEAKLAVEAVAAKPVEPEIKIEPPKKTIKIGTKEFTDPQEAIEYAKELAQETAENKAYIEGVKDASKKPDEPTTPEETAYEKFSKDVFIDPVKAAKEFSDNIKQEIFDTYNASIEKQTAENDLKRQRAEAWDNFYKTNPDLSSEVTRKIVASITNPANPEKWNQVKDLSRDEGLKKVAELARQEIAELKKALLPTQEMFSGNTSTTGVSGDQTPTTTQEKEYKSVAFTDALNNMRAGKKKKTS